MEWVAYATEPITRTQRVLATRPQLNAALSAEQAEFIQFVVDRYIASGVEELDADKLPTLLQLKYEALQDGLSALGGADQARATFFAFQRQLYEAV